MKATGWDCRLIHAPRLLSGKRGSALRTFQGDDTIPLSNGSPAKIPGLKRWLVVHLHVLGPLQLW